MIPYTREAYDLLHEGSLTLAEIEANGIRVDVKYLDETIEKQQRRIKRLRGNLDKHKVMKLWLDEYGQRTKLNSGEQLGHILFDIMGHECPAYTPGGDYKTDEKTLSAIDDPFVQDYLRIKKYSKLVNTYLMGIRREVINGFLHPFFSLHLVRTFRSSSDSPNFQNIPVRDPQIGKIVRQTFIARPGRRIVEIDYSGAEVCVAACYHKDPTMLEYLHDPTKDMHRDMAMECYKLSLNELTPTGPDDAKRVKNIRYCGKNCFVFPQFYGDWYIDCARALWDSMISMGLHLRDGTPLKDHLRTKGIRRLGDLDPKEEPSKGTFERHIQKVEQRMWNKRFPVYNEWRFNHVAEYKKNGWMKTLTGFICQGHMKRNEIINYPVQGSAFHCLLWSLSRLRKVLKKERMKTLLIGQIHDSALADVPDNELQDFLAIAHEVMVNDLKAEWDWIMVPIEIEAEVTPVDGNWYQKKEMAIG